MQFGEGVGGSAAGRGLGQRQGLGVCDDLLNPQAFGVQRHGLGDDLVAQLLVAAQQRRVRARRAGKAHAHGQHHVRRFLAQQLIQRLAHQAQGIGQVVGLAGVYLQ